MLKLPALALILSMACIGRAAAGPADKSRVENPPAPGPTQSAGPSFGPAHAMPAPSLASLAVAVGQSDGFATPSLPAAGGAPAANASAAAQAPSPDGTRGLGQGTADAFWGVPVTGLRPARPGNAAPPAPGLLIDASTGQSPDGGPLHPRAPGAYAPYQSAPPVLEQNLDAAALLSSLEARGFTDVSQLKLRGSAYTCEATGPRRERVRLVVDAASGAIFGVEVIGYDSRRN